MTPLSVMQAVYELLTANPPTGVKKIFDPGRPAGPFAANLPAIIITTGTVAERRDYVAEDTRIKTINIHCHVLTRDPLERLETRGRGNYAQLYSILSEIADRLETAGNLSGAVDELESIEISDTGPDHGRVQAVYNIVLPK